MTKPPKNHHRELIELAALFVAAGLADLFTDVLGHRVEGPSALIILGVVVAAVTFARHRPVGRGAPPPRAGSAAPFPVDPADPALLAGPSGRLWRVRTMVEDTPGRLAVLAGAFAAVGANILTLQVHPYTEGAVDEFLVEAPGEVAAQQLGAVVAAAGGGQVHVEAADVTALADVPTRALALARRLADDPGELARVLVELLDATEAVWLAPDEAAGSAGSAESARTGRDGHGTESTAIRVHGPNPAVLLVSRPQVPFTFVEFARAQAMADLAAALHRDDPPPPAPGPAARLIAADTAL
ncbi:hypothetical protein KGA66_22705 [Actinocrinis puniceicyclus]|uniref:ACT domain-containing protein n=1 Tax=Actinocrinis puniceicyclus TaxID=977794 RepID=A0A8J7WSW6_9ACTN|nr:hypothetical protein [Actinocrinis puniceicyclus]MBS2965877.1 hypothetical protein [Actinocrinis puniceicyclus]